MVEDTFELPDWAPIVLAHTRSADRAALATLLAFDMRLARIVHSASEPMLGQVRLAWWRDELARERPAGSPSPPDPLLSSILGNWGANLNGLLALLNGWENLIGDAPWPSECHAAFCKGRVLAFSAFADLVGENAHRDSAGLHGHAWGLAELAMCEQGLSGQAEALPRLPQSLRSLAIIGGLSKRAVSRGGQPILGDRLSPLVALRLGIFGV